MRFIFGVLVMVLAISPSFAQQSYEIVITKFKEHVSYKEQQAAMGKLNTIVIGFSGFISRDYFYSEDLQQWVDLVQWEDLEAAQAASKQVMNNPEALSVFGLIDESNMSFSHYRHMGKLSP